MRITIALGGNALLRRGELMSADNQVANIAIAAERISQVATSNEVLLTHGNGPQVGLLALQSDAYKEVPLYPLDVLGAESQAMIGYMLEQEMRARLPEREFASIVTTCEVDRNDPAFDNPTKFIGPVYSKDEGEALASEHGWTMKADGEYLRRVVASPRPERILEENAILALLDRGIMPICCGGGGVPVVRGEANHYDGAPAVIDKDLCAALLATRTTSDLLVIATDVDGIYLDWGTDSARRLEQASVAELEASEFAAGSMGPKVQAACEFVKQTGNPAVIGSLEDIARIVEGTGGTRVTP